MRVGSRMEEKKPESACLSTLPDELLFIVSGHLDVVSRIRLRRVNSKWKWILRDPAAWRTIKIEEREHRRWEPMSHKHNIRHPPPPGLLELLTKADVFKHVKHLVLEGDYDLLNQGPRASFWPLPWMGLFSKTMDYILKSKDEGSKDFEKLDTILVRKAVINLDNFGYLADLAFKCQLIVESGSFVTKVEQWWVEFGIPESRTFNLSGRTAWLVTRESVVIPADEYDGVGFLTDRMPLEVAEFVAERCNRVPAEEVAELGSIYAELLRGRNGVVIPEEVLSLFDDVVRTEQNNAYDPNREHWEQCKGYDFNSVGNWLKYALVYYARPRNCYNLVVVDRVTADIRPRPRSKEL